MRLQGKAFYAVKHQYKITCFSISKNGNIKVYLQHKEDENNKATHWLSDVEKEKFLQSDYYQNRIVLPFKGTHGCILYGTKGPMPTNKDATSQHIVGLMSKLKSGLDR